MTIRPASEADLTAILGFIRELAEFEKLSHEVVADEERLRHTLFGPRPYAEVQIAEWEREPVGMALYFYNYSTFLASPGLYLEDLYVRPEFRSKGIGLRLLKRLAGIAVERGCGRFEWSVLDWNERALKFYRSIGAEPMSDWTVQRLSGAALSRLAGETD